MTGAGEDDEAAEGTKRLNWVSRWSEEEGNLYLVMAPVETLFDESFSSWTMVSRVCYRSSR
jgi:hypothetical protein